MADRYWVGGSGSWNSTTKWAATSGGASGASVPTSADNAIFDAASSAAHYTVTVTANATCANLTFTPEPVDGVTQFVVDTGFVIAGTFSTSGTQGNRRAWFRSSTYGLTRDMQIAVIGAVTDVDFRDIRITGAGGTLSGTRIGDLRGCSNITFDAPKSVYWVTLAGGNWSGNNWAPSSGGTASTNSFPLAQDTAVIENTGLNTSATVTMDSAIGYAGTVSMGTRTNAMTLTLGAAQTINGNWTNGSGTTLSGALTLTFSGRTTQVITSAGKTFGNPITVDTYGGSVELADALNIGTNTLTVTNGTFDTKSYNVTAGSISSTGVTVRAITLGTSTVTLSGAASVTFTTSTNLTLSAGTSSIVCSGSSATFAGGNLSYNSVSFTTITASVTITGTNTFSSLSVTPFASAGLLNLSCSANQTITGTLTVAGATAVRRIFVRSDTLGTPRTLTVGTLAATDCDFRDITIAGTAAGSSPTRAGDCGGNTGITFPAAKTVYWNLAGTQNWSATGWAPSSGGTVDINQFPLAQDTAVFDNTGAAGTVTINAAWNIGTFDASLRTSAMTLTFGTATSIHGSTTFGTGVTTSGASTISFFNIGTATLTSNGVLISGRISIERGKVQLGDALNISTGSAIGIVLNGGEFDAVTYNVTNNKQFSFGSGTLARTLRMGSGLWTLSGTGVVWDATTITNAVFYKGTANIVLSDTSTTARSFDGGGLSYNKLTIGGTTGISTLTITSNNQFTELASTKTVAHTIALGTTAQTFGKWTVTGTVGNVVTLTGTGTSHILAGAATSGIDRLAMGSIGFAATSPGEFYAGANSTGTAAAPVYRTAPPAGATRYWVGGTGNWSSTTKWSASSGGGSGASVPTSLDNVVFDAASNATAYTATVDAAAAGVRMKALTIAGPASGNVTLAGTQAIYIHDNVTLPATGLTRTFTGAITLTGSTTGRTLTTNGVALASAITVDGVACGWSLGSALDIGSNVFTITNGSFNTANFNATLARFASGTSGTANNNSRTLTLGSSTITASSEGFQGNGVNITLSAGTSQFNISAGSPTFGTFGGDALTFYNVSFTSTSAGAIEIRGANSFNNLSFTGITAAGLKNISLTANQTVTGTLTFSAGTDATMRHFCQSSVIGTTRTITAAAVSMTDVDFRDITIAGAAAPASGTRIGDCKGNSGITFTAAANKYWNLAGGGNWGGALAWALTSGGPPALNNFPLAQDTCLFEATSPNNAATVTLNAAYNIGSIDMSGRTANTMTLAVGSTTPAIYGNWVNGSGVTLSGGGTLTFAGRSSQLITNAGVTFTTQFTVNSPSGSVTLQDAFLSNNSNANALRIDSGTFDAGTYNVTFSGASSGINTTAATTSKTVAVGSGTWTIAGANGWLANTTATVTGTGTISLTSASAKTFAGGGAAYTGITLNQGGAGTLTITGNNTFKDITNTYKATGATTINMGTTTQRVAQWTAAGEAGRLLTVQGTSATSPCTLVHTGTGTAANVDYLALTGVRAY